MLNMIKNIINIVFTNYLVILTLGSGIVLGIILPYIKSDTKYKKEYIITRYIGYFYILAGLLMFVAARIF